MTDISYVTNETGLQAIHKQWAIWATRKLRFLRPELSLTLYRKDWNYTLHVENWEDDSFPILAEFFDQKVRPATCSIILAREVPDNSIPVEEIENYGTELWLNGEPLSAPDLNKLLFLAEPNLPVGGIDFDNNQNSWIFHSHTDLTDEERSRVLRATNKVGIIGNVDFVSVSAPKKSPTSPSSTHRNYGTLDLATSRQLMLTRDVRKDLVAQDEDEWRDFLLQRSNQEILSDSSSHPSSFACLYDAEHCGESRLSELLTIYDRVDIMPDKLSSNWQTKHQVSIQDLQELAKLKRVRLILPYSATDYPSQLVEAVAEVDRSSIVLSRTLAAKTILRGQEKDPLLYAPLTSSQRAAILSVITGSVTDETYRGLPDSYGEIFSRQHYMLMMRGALAFLGCGVGAYLGDIFLKLSNKDARLELMTCGAGIEWALGLGASYIPRDFGGYDESWNSQIIASYMGRTKLMPSDPVVNRMHLLTDGLLAVSDVPPLEVAKNFHSLPVSRFRNLAKKLMTATADAAELQGAIDNINADVKSFERRADRLSRWNLGSLATGITGVAVEPLLGGATSVIALWLCEVLKNRLPSSIRDELDDAINMITGLATGSTLDAVIVSRSRKAIVKK